MMFYNFGVKENDKDRKGKGPATGVAKRPVSKKTENKHKNGTLIYGSPLFNFLYKHSNGSNIGIPVSTTKKYTASNELFWVFRKNPETDPSLNQNPVQEPTQKNVSYIYVKKVNNKPTVTVWYEHNGQGAFRTIRFAGSEQSAGTNVSNSDRKPIFYIEVYDPATGKATKKLYGDVIYVKTPNVSPQGSPVRGGPSGVYDHEDLPDYRSPSRSPPRSPRRSMSPGYLSSPGDSPGKLEFKRFMRNDFGKKRGVNLKTLRKDLKMVMKF
jgi:hypothetical protein